MKKIKMLLMGSLMFLLCTVSLYAYEQSGKKLGPRMSPGGSPVNGNVYSLESSYDTAYVSNTEVSYSELGYLEEGFAKAERSFPIWLYDQDGFGNEDDRLKTYEGYFHYDFTNLAYIQLESSIESYDNIIDTTNDRYGELYIRAQLGYVSGDANPIWTELFYYNIILN